METLELIKKTKYKRQERPSKPEFSFFSLSAECGALVFGCFMTYFLVMRTIGLHEMFVLRYLNALFLVAGILFAFHSYKKSNKQDISYKKSLQIGALITLMAVIPFCLFIYLYLNFDDGFYGLIEKDVELRGFISPGTVACFICLEGLSSGSIITFIIAKILKKKTS